MTATSKTPFSRVANLLFGLRVGSDANLFGRMVYGLFHIWGVEGLPPIPNPPRNLTQISKVPRGYGLPFGKQVYGYVFSRLRDKEKTEEMLSEFLTIKIMDKQHKLADKFKGLPLDEAEKIVMVAVKNFLSTARRDEGRQERIEGPGTTDLSDSEHLLDTSDGASSLDNLFSEGEMNQIVQEVQRILVKKNPEVARDIPLYFEHLMDGLSDSKIINNKMLPFLQERPMSQQAWSKGYREVIKDVLDKHLERHASASPMTMERVARLVSATASKTALNENTLKLLHYEGQLEYLQSVFTSNTALKLFDYVKDLSRQLADDDRFSNVFGFQNWDYGSPKQSGNEWSIRVWMKDSPNFQLANGDESRGNLLIKLAFKDGKVDVELVRDNSKTLFSKTLSGTQASPSIVGTYLADAWSKALTGRA